jgi:syntaxin-binding protein 1
MYLLMPTSQNVDRVVRDFSNRQQYGAAHLFFIDGALQWAIRRRVACDPTSYRRTDRESRFER